MISMARILGAPESVPAGNAASSASSAEHSGRIFAVTDETMWMRCE